MPRMLAKAVLVVAFLVASTACGYDASATFHSDGSVTVGLKFLFPAALMQGGSSGSVGGFSPADISKANAALAAKYPGGKVTLVTEGDESGALITIPFKTEKEAFAFLTQPSELSPGGPTSGSSSSIDLSKTGGVFASATHSTSGQTDTYVFKTQPAAQPSPSPGDPQSPITTDELASIFTVTFTLTLPHAITSAPGALFTLDGKTAVWKLNWTKAETFTATTGPGAGLGGLVANQTVGQNAALLLGIALVAIGVGFLLGMLQPWRRMGAAPALAPAAAAGPVESAAPIAVPVETPPSLAGPPADLPPPPPSTPPS